MYAQVALAAAQAGMGIYEYLAAQKKQQQAERAMKTALNNRATPEVSAAVNEGLAEARASQYAASPSTDKALKGVLRQAADLYANNLRNGGAGAFATNASMQGKVGEAMGGIAAQDAAMQGQRDANVQRMLLAKGQEEQRVQAQKAEMQNDYVNMELGKMGAASATKGQAMGLAAQSIGTLGTALEGAGSKTASKETSGTGTSKLDNPSLDGSKLPGYMTGSPTGAAATAAFNPLPATTPTLPMATSTIPSLVSAPKPKMWYDDIPNINNPSVFYADMAKKIRKMNGL